MYKRQGMACGGQVRVEFLYLPAGRESAQELARRAAQSGSGRVPVSYTHL